MTKFLAKFWIKPKFISMIVLRNKCQVFCRKPVIISTTRLRKFSPKFWIKLAIISIVATTNDRQVFCKKPDRSTVTGMRGGWIVGDKLVSKKLTAKQKAFIDAYLSSFNATQSAIKAGYSEKTAYSIGSENLRKPVIKAEIERRMEDIIPKAEVITRLAEHARGDIGMFVDPATLTLDIKAAIERGDTSLIKKIKQTLVTRTVGAEEQQTEIFEFELYDAQKALALLGRYHKLFVDRQEVSAPGGGPIVVIRTGMSIDAI